MRQNGVGDEGCVALASAMQQHKAWPRLTHLVLCGNGIGDEGCAALGSALQSGPCPRLVHLQASDNHITAEGCASLARGLCDGCPELMTLDLSSNHTTALADELGEQAHLCDLNVGWNRLTRIQPELYDAILRANNVYATGNRLEEPPQAVVEENLEVLKKYVEEELM